LGRLTTINFVDVTDTVTNEPSQLFEVDSHLEEELAKKLP